MILGIDSVGKVVLVCNGVDASTMLTEWNGIAIAAHVLSAEQEAAYLALSPRRAGTIFNAGIFTEVAAAAPTYRELRASEYPPAADYLDGVVKGDAVQVQRYVDACLAVKARYPKPR